jgi:hypothetical protein
MSENNAPHQIHKGTSKPPGVLKISRGGAARVKITGPGAKTSTQQPPAPSAPPKQITPKT